MTTPDPDALRASLKQPEKRGRRSAVRIARCGVIKNLKVVLLVLLLNAPAWDASGVRSFLRVGDEAVLATPVTHFQTELLRLPLPPSEFRAVTNPVVTAMELPVVADLRLALQLEGTADAERIVAAYAEQHQKLLDYAEAVRRRRYAGDSAGEDIRFPEIVYPEGLPGEFRDYLEGVAAEHNPALKERRFSRVAWERILKRPADERRFLSVPAALNLGRSCESEAPGKAIRHYQQVRELVRSGFHDRRGDAAASIGWEARLRLRAGDYETALRLYVDHMATGDPTAASSLMFTLRAIVADDDYDWTVLARDPLARRVVTAYLTSTVALKHAAVRPRDAAERVNRWLQAMEEVADVDDDLAEMLALAAYQNEQWDLTERWIERCSGRPVAQWLRARLLARSGRLEDALAVLQTIQPRFRERKSRAPGNLEDNLFGRRMDGWEQYMSPDLQVLGEMGVLHLCRCDYIAALDCFLKANLWEDAAYVAERVLTIEELRRFVDAIPDESGEGLGKEPAPHLEALRHLLARRLMRAGRAADARRYYPRDLQSRCDALAEALSAGRDGTLPAEERARWLFAAAVLVRTNGMELLGTELEPDWHMYSGRVARMAMAKVRAGDAFKYFRASSDEMARVSRHRPDPDARFHYRYQAAFLAWEASELLPDNSEDTASVLWTAGTWLKYRDPETADIFYKALVNRCRGTELGFEADRIRWFPRVEE